MLAACAVRLHIPPDPPPLPTINNNPQNSPQASAPDYILDLINIDFAASKLAQEQEMELELQRAREAGEEEPQVCVKVLNWFVWGIGCV